ncbi:MAG: class A beta-lactamase [Steroidobacteraceae bacterium]
MIRRDLLKGAVAGVAAVLIYPVVAKSNDVAARLADLERKRGGRLGVAVLDADSDHRVSHRGDERFLMCSTFKFLLVAAVLTRVDRSEERLGRRIVFTKDVVLNYAPMTKHHVGPPGMTIAQLCEAAVTLSDNTAANLLLTSIGGPSGVTHYARSLGDPFTLLDRMEPALNPYDTTTPNATVADMQEILLGHALSQVSREQLIRWMLNCQTGLESLRAGFPDGWRVGDKTGQWDGNGVGANNDIAVAWPPERKPLLVTAYYDNAHAAATERKAVLAEVARAVATPA